MKGAFQIFRVKGIAVKLHITFVVLLPLFVVSYASELAADGSLVSIGLSLSYSFLFFIILFGSVLMHELVHSFVALRNGMKVTQITLTPIGGIASAAISKNPGKEFKVAAAGPISNFALALTLLGLGIVVSGPSLLKHFTVEALSTPSGVGLFVSIVYVNLMLGAFNLFLPIFPMDGGRILRSLLAMVTDYRKATKIAVNISQVFIIMLIGFAISIGSLWLIMIGVFLLLAGFSELQASEIEATLAAIDLRRYAHTNIAMVHPEIPMREFIELAIPWQTIYPVIDSTGKPVGYIDLHALKPEDLRKRAKEIMSGDFPAVKLGQRANLLEKLYGKGFIFILDEEGRFYGAVTLKSIEEAMQLHSLRKN